MKLEQGQTYQLRNLVTQERAELRLIEIDEYKGQFLVYGVTGSHSVYVPATRGVVRVAERPSSCVILPGESAENIKVFVRALRGLPLALIQGDDVLYIVNTGRIPTVWEGQTYATREEHLEKCKKVVDLYWEWRDKGEFPAWFRLVRTATGSGGAA